VHVQVSDMRGKWSDAVQQFTFENRPGTGTGCPEAQPPSSSPYARR
jgi:hypothetical protein